MIVSSVKWLKLEILSMHKAIAELYLKLTVTIHVLLLICGLLTTLILYNFLSNDLSESQVPLM